MSNRNSRPGLSALVILLVGLPLAAAGRSSLTARVLDAVAGPDLEQTARVVVDYFPGDGEAIVGATVAPSTDAVRILSARAGRAQARLEAGEIRLDYRARPIGSHTVDTVAVTLVASGIGAIPWALSLSTNVDRGQATADRFEAVLLVEPPLEARGWMAPTQVYPGETTQVTMSVVGRARDGGPLAGADVAWPEAVHTAGATRTVASGDTIHCEFAVRVAVDADTPLGLTVTARGGALRSSPVAVEPLRVAPVPAFRARTLAPALAGQVAWLQLVWANGGAEAIPYAALTASAQAGWAQGTGRTAGLRLEADEDKGSLRATVAGPGQIAPGDSLAVDLEVTPTGSGPYAWAAGYQPPDRPAPVALGGAVVHVTAAPATAGMSDSVAPPTDLELAGGGLRRELAAALAEMPVGQGSALTVDADQKDEGNWVVEGLLTELLLERGLRVLVAPEAGPPGVHALRYRLVDAEVVYYPVRGGLSPFGRGRRRESRVEVFLRLEDPLSRVLWARQVVSRAGDTAPAAAAPWLGGAKGIAQAQVEPDHRAVEVGLSGLIVGGLFFVFFAP